MLKILFRIVAILLVAGLVAGGIYAFVAGGGISQADAGRLDGRSHIASEGSPRPSHPDGDRDLQEGFSPIGLVGVAGQAAKVALITALVALIRSVARRFTARREPRRLAT